MATGILDSVVIVFGVMLLAAIGILILVVGILAILYFLISWSVSKIWRE